MYKIKTYLSNILDVKRNEKKKTKLELAEKVGRTRGYLFQTVDNGKVSLNNAISILNELDCDLIVVDDLGNQWTLLEKKNS